MLGEGESSDESEEDYESEGPKRESANVEANSADREDQGPLSLRGARNQRC